MPVTQTIAPQTADATASRWRRDRLFYAAFTAMAIATVLAGFGPTYYLKTSGGPKLSPLIQLHAALFTTWMLVFAVQVFLVANRRTDIHRRLGLFGVIVALAILVAGYITAIAGVRTGWTGPRTPRDTVEALNFPVVPLGSCSFLVSLLPRSISGVNPKRTNA